VALDVSEVIDRKPVKQVKILVITAVPLDRQGIQYEMEQDYLLETFKDFDRREVFLDMPDPVKGTLEEMRENLETGHHDILLISAYGNVDDQGEGFLLLEDAGGKEQRVPGRELAKTLQALAVRPRIVMVSASFSAKPGPPALSVAQALFDSGIDAVVGMKGAISDAAAVDFSCAFLAGMTGNRTVTEAFQSGKQAIEKHEQTRIKENPQWLYLHEADIPQLFTREETLNRKDFNDFIIEAPNRPQGHDFLGAKYREHGFIGRRQILRQIYRQVEERVGAIVLKGPSGIGKSTLVTRVAGQLRRWGYDFIVIQGQTSEAAILQAISHKAQQMGIKDAGGASQASTGSRDKLKGYLDNFLLKERLLVIFDNFESNQAEDKAGGFASQTLREFLHYFKDCLAGHESLMLFSSRYAVPGFEGLEVGELTPVEFRKLLLNSKSLGRLDGTSMGALMREIGGNPRAIELVDIISREEFGSREVSWQELKKLLPQIEQRLLEKHDKADDFTPIFLERLLSYLTAGQRRLLDVIGIFRLPVAEAAAVALGEVIEIPDRQRLVDLSLLEYRAAGDTFYVHRLIAGYVLGRLAEDVKKTYHRQAAEYLAGIEDNQGNHLLDNMIEARWHYLQAEAWNEAAEITFDLYSYLDLHGFPQQSFELLQELVDKPLSDWNRANVSYLLGILEQGFGLYDPALAHYREAKDIFERLDDKRSISAALHQIGIIYYLKGDYDSALEQYQNAKTTCEELGDDEGISVSLHDIGIIYEERGDYDAALEQYKKSLEIKKKIGDIKGMAKSLHQVGMIYQKRGEYDKALEHYRKSLEIKEKIGDIKGMAGSLHQVGIIHQSKGDYDAALESYQKAREIADKIGDTKLKALGLLQVGSIYRDKGEYDAALRQYLEALETFAGIGDIKNAAGCRHQIGTIYQQKSEYAAALEQYRKALETFEKIGDKSGMAISFGQLGQLYSQQGQWETSLINFLRAYLIFARQKSPYVGQVTKEIDRVRKKIPEERFKDILERAQKGEYPT